VLQNIIGSLPEKLIRDNSLNSR